MRTFSDHTEQEQLPGARLVSPTPLKLVGIPWLRPLLRIFFYSGKKKVVDESNMSRKGGVELTVKLKVEEEILPLVAKRVHHVKPKTLKSCVRNTFKEQRNWIRDNRGGKKVGKIRTGLICTIHVPCF